MITSKAKAILFPIVVAFRALYFEIVTRRGVWVVRIDEQGCERRSRLGPRNSPGKRKAESDRRVYQPLFFDKSKFSTTIENPVVLGRPALLLSEDYELVENSVFWSSERNSSAIASQAVSDQNRLRRKPVVPTRSNQMVCLLTSPWNHFGHWIPEQLPKVLRIRDTEDFHQTTFVLEVNPPDWKIELLRRAGVRDENIVSRDFRNQPQMFARGLVTEFSSPNREDLLRIRELFGDVLSPHANSPRRVFLSRQSWPSRRILNFTSVERILDQHEVAVIEPERLTFGEQVSVVAGSNLLVGPQGSAFTLQIFVKDGSSIIELHGRNRVHLYNSEIANVLGHNYQGIFDPRPPIGRHMRDEDIVVDLMALQKALEAIDT